MWSSILVELEIGDVGFHGGKKTREKTLEQGENKQQTQQTHGAGLESNPGHIGGRRSLSPLCHPGLTISFTSLLDVPAEPWSYPQLPSRM